MKCPQCGKELSKDDILIPMFDKEGKIIDCYHVPFRIWEEFIEMCEMKEVEPSDILEELVQKFVESQRKKKR